MAPWARGVLFTTLAAIGGAALGMLVVGPPGARVVIAGYEYALEAGDRVELASLLEHRTRQVLGGEAHLDAEGEYVHTTLGELGFEVDLESATRELETRVAARKLEARKSPALWLARLVTREPYTVFFELPVHLEDARAEVHLHELGRLVARDPVDAEMRISEHEIVPSREGRRLSVPATLVRLRGATIEEDLVVAAVVEEIRPDVTEEDLAPVDVSLVLAEFKTSFAGKAGPREVNIRAAARFLNGAVILPGETFSFNERVGRRIHGRGFVDAPVIVNDEMEDDVGGGVCQVATTLHAAAVFGDLDVVRRRSHSRPSGYAPLGLDATVIDGSVDLLIRNPYDEPLLVHATFPRRYELEVEILGRNPTAKVEHAAAVTHSEPFTRRVWFKDHLAPDAIEKKQKGSPGMDVVSVLRVVHEDGKTERRTYFSKYYPVPEVFHVGAKVSPALLPALPEGATGTVINGEEAPDVALPSRGPASPEDVPTSDEVHAPSRGGGNG